MEAAINAHDDALEPMRERIEAALLDYNEKVGELKTSYAKIHGGVQAYYDDRSEGWQESDAGQEYQEWA